MLCISAVNVDLKYRTNSISVCRCEDFRRKIKLKNGFCSISSNSFHKFIMQAQVYQLSLGFTVFLYALMFLIVFLFVIIIKRCYGFCKYSLGIVAGAMQQASENVLKNR